MKEVLTKRKEVLSNTKEVFSKRKDVLLYMKEVLTKRKELLVQVSPLLPPPKPPCLFVKLHKQYTQQTKTVVA
jgi:hypothetical protein